MTAAAPWLRNEPVPDWRRATVAELVEVWRRLRNSHGAMMAADELMRRERDELRAALGTYGRHSDDCDDANAYNGERHGPCGCGLDAAIDAKLREDKTP